MVRAQGTEPGVAERPAPAGPGAEPAAEPDPPPEPVQPPPPALMVRALTKSFGGVAALSDVDLELSRGEVLALVGENGAGKSTLVNVLSGMYRPSSGTIFVDGARVRIRDPRQAKALGIATVFQGLALCDSLDVVTNLFLGREVRPLWLDEKTMERHSRQLMRQVQSTVTRVRMEVGALSGGQRQTVAIARTLLADPAVVILDEPTASLGSTQRIEVLNQIVQLRGRGLGVMIVSHNLDDVGAVADRVAVLRRGRLNGVFDVATTTTEQVHEAMSGITTLPTGFAAQGGGRHESPPRR